MNEPLLLLPGMMCDARLFASQVSEFSADYPVIVPVLTGQSTFAELCKDILAHAPPRFALAGLSMGGIIAMEIVRQAPERVSRLALMDTNPLAEPAIRAMERDAQIERVRNGGLSSVMRDEMLPNYLADGSKNDDLLTLCMEMAEALGADVFTQQSRALQQRRDQCDTLRRIDMPTLILCGEYDALCPLERHVMMCDLISGARLAVIPGAGHLPVLERSELTNKEIKLWLNT
ncbi:alpha/beta fold hydrolase [Glaciecola sp. 33A]|jgi:pimeloyl-ACP methyl ester carboxylesterase|uniref:alpha/beta fold hydrolase n=1 Tax=Glaciecola sp. 33A TaxID=2057807 RepID=UPI000C3369E8|nr:alpha/beta hydrolase [Glaciecola sp. 33A]PKI03560.1 alpha/beta hydrolase [Glaciecola sp. 33A]